MKYEKFEDLPIWKLSVEVAKSIYELTTKSKFKNEFSLVNQLRNSIMLVNTNIVEGFESYKDFPKFLLIAKWHVQKLRSQLYISLEVEIISKEEFNLVVERLNDLVNQISWLVYYMKKSKSEKSTKDQGVEVDTKIDAKININELVEQTV